MSPASRAKIGLPGVAMACDFSTSSRIAGRTCSSFPSVRFTSAWYTVRLFASCGSASRWRSSGCTTTSSLRISGAAPVMKALAM